MEKIELEQKFMELVEQWRRETYTSPDPIVIIQHPAYQKIISMGQPVIPLILKELEQRPSLWFTALEAIIGEDPIDEEFQSNTRKMRSCLAEMGTR